MLSHASPWLLDVEVLLNREVLQILRLLTRGSVVCQDSVDEHLLLVLLANHLMSCGSLDCRANSRSNLDLRNLLLDHHLADLLVESVLCIPRSSIANCYSFYSLSKDFLSFLGSSEVELLLHVWGLLKGSLVSLLAPIATSFSLTASSTAEP